MTVTFIEHCGYMAVQPKRRLLLDNLFQYGLYQRQRHSIFAFSEHKLHR